MSKKIIIIFLWFFIGLLSLGQFQRIEMSGLLNGINIYYHDIFIFLWILSFTLQTAIKHFTGNIKKISILIFSKKKWTPEIYFLVIATVGIFVNLFLYKDFISILYVVRLLMYVSFASSLKSLITAKKINFQDLRFKFFGVGSIILLLGFLQFAYIKDTRFLNVLGWDDHFNRLISTMFDPGYTGIIFVITYFYFLSLKKLSKNMIANIFITLGLFWGIALTFSRATYLSLIISLIVMNFIERKKWSLSLTFKICLFILMIFIAPKPGGEGVDLTRTSSINARKSSFYSELSKISFKTLVIGNGLFSFKNSIQDFDPKIMIQIPSHSRMPDNIFINFLLSTGLIGTILASTLVIKWIMVVSKTDPSLAVAVIATIVHSQFSNSLLQPFVLLILLGGIASTNIGHQKKGVKK